MQTTAPNALWRTGRLQAGMTQAQVARAIKINREHISRIESGIVKPGLPIIRKLSALYGLEHSEVEILKMYVETRKANKGLTPDEEALIRAFRKQDLTACLRILSENLK